MATKTPPNERAAKRRKLAKKGHALPDGSFPIPNAAYLEKAKHRIGSAHPSKRAAAKALINRRAKELGRPGLGGQDPKSTPRKKKKKPVKTSEDFSGAILLVSSSVYPGLDRSPKANWVDKAGGLPNYIERIAKHLHYEKGMDISRAIATAVNVVKKMCATGELNWPGHQTANAGSQAEACAAVASWEKKRLAFELRLLMFEVVSSPILSLPRLLGSPMFLLIEPRVRVGLISPLTRVSILGV